MAGALGWVGWSARGGGMRDSKEGAPALGPTAASPGLARGKAGSTLPHTHTLTLTGNAGV